MKQDPMLEQDILDDMRLAAHELAQEAWDEGIRAGIPADLLAEELVHAVMGEMANMSGQSGAARLSEKIGKLANEGRFLAPRLLQ